MYICYDDEKNCEKRSSKGIPHSVKINLEQYKKCLFNEGEKHMFPAQSLRLDKNKQMCRMTTQKAGLSDLFVKMHVSNDKITCKPIQLDGKTI